MPFFRHFSHSHSPRKIRKPTNIPPKKRIGRKNLANPKNLVKSRQQLLFRYATHAKAEDAGGTTHETVVAGDPQTPPGDPVARRTAPIVTGVDYVVPTSRVAAPRCGQKYLIRCRAENSTSNTCTVPIFCPSTCAI